MDVSLPASLVEIGKWAFGDSWTYNIQFPENLKKIGDYAFTGTHMESVYLPDSLEELGTKAFLACENVKEVRFPNHMTVIPAYSFGGCTALESIEWPEDVEK